MPLSPERPTSVVCQILSEEIPADICDVEQGAKHCKGCTAKTRRCLSCGKRRGIADAERGWCEACLAQSGETLIKSESQDKPDLSLESVIARVRAVRTVGPNDVIVARSEKDEQPLVQAAIAKDLTALNLVLLEHGVARDGVWVINVPRTVLIRHARLLPEEADDALKRLVTREYLKGTSPWHSAVLLKTDGIEAIQQRLTTASSVRSTSDALKRQRRARGEKVLSAPRLTRTRHLPPKPSATRPAAKSLGTYAGAYAYLRKERAQSIAGKLIVRGAVPALQIRWRMGPEETKSVLTKLVSDGHIALLDGWRSLELLKADIVDATPLPGGEVTKSSGSLAARAQRLPRRPALQLRTAAVSAAQTDTVSNSLEKVIQVLEQRVKALRDLEGGNEQELKAFEVCVATLKREKDGGTELSPSVRKALTGSVLASVKRLVALGGK